MRCQPCESALALIAVCGSLAACEGSEPVYGYSAAVVQASALPDQEIVVDRARVTITPLWDTPLDRSGEISTPVLERFPGGTSGSPFDLFDTTPAMGGGLATGHTCADSRTRYGTFRAARSGGLYRILVEAPGFNPAVRWASFNYSPRHDTALVPICDEMASRVVPHFRDDPIVMYRRKSS